jgi:hypothetical protein
MPVDREVAPQLEATSLLLPRLIAAAESVTGRLD